MAASGDAAAVAVLRIAGLDLRYGRRQVLRDLSLDVGVGVTGLLGPNGAGKSSLMRCVAGITPWDQGEIVVDGVDSRRHPTRSRRRIGFVPERAGFFSELRVDRCLRFAAAAAGLSRAEQSSAVERVVDDFDLGPVRTRVVGNLSKGYRQRVGLAQAVIAEPPLLLLDEASSGLDPLVLEDLYAMIQGYGRAHAVLLSTHVLADVEAVCDRVVVLDDGLVLGGWELQAGGPAPSGPIHGGLAERYRSLLLLHRGNPVATGVQEVA
jgi:ABC-2 type transport system ATP-binding protein